METDSAPGGGKREIAVGRTFLTWECGHPGSQSRHISLVTLLTIGVDGFNPVGWRESRPSHWLGISGQEEVVSRVAEQQSCREKGRAGGWRRQTDG